MRKDMLFRCLTGCLTLLSALVGGGCNQEPAPFVCKDTIGCVDVGPKEPLKFGVLQALSGKVASLGNEQIRGIELALINRQKELLGHPVVLQTEDDGCTAEGGANAALKIIADPQIVAILGSTCSGAAVTASAAMSQAGLTMISGNNSAPFLTAVAGKKAAHWQAGYFRTAPNEETAGKAAAQYAFEKLGLRKAATINDGDIYTRGLTESFEAAFQQLGGKIVLSTSLNKGDEQMQPYLTAVQNAEAQLLFFPLFQPEGNRILLQARETAGFEQIVLMSGGALIEKSFIEAVGDKAKGMYFVGPAKPSGAAVDTLEKQYLATFQTPPAAIYYQNAYDAASLLFAAIEQVAVKEADGTLHIGRQALRGAMIATKIENGVCGSVSCDAFGDCARPIFNILRLDDPASGVEALQTNVQFTYAPQP
jgi:branched-chain amino acid transport system substrate-binding protein